MDSYDLHLRCWLRTFQKFGIGSDASNVMKHLGKSHIDMAHALVPGINDELAMEIASTEKELFKDSKRELRLFPSAIEVLSEAGANLNRTIMGHLDRTVFLRGTLTQIAEAGCYMEWDLFGTENSYYALNPNIDMPSDAKRMDDIAWISSAVRARL